MQTAVLLFDLGGVLVELTGVPVLGRWAREEREAEIWRRWLACRWVRRFERGECDALDFAAGVVEDWELDVSPQHFLEAFRRWPRGLYPEAAALLESLAGKRRLACFSNTNDLHWPRFRDELGLGRLFHHHFVSHEMGLVKPDRAAFDHVVAALDVAPEQILFLDDNQPNVDGARAAGLDAERAVGVEGARSILTSRGILEQ